MMNNNSSEPLVSVVIPTLNEEKYIEDTLKALHRQTYRNLEIIVVDDESDDNTVEIARQYADEVVIEEATIGGARNMGARLSGGYIFLFLDADTVPYDNYVEEMVKSIQEEGYVAAIGCDSRPQEHSLITNLWVRLTNVMVRLGNIIPGIVPPTGTLCVSIAVRRDAFEEAGGFDENLIGTEELDFARSLESIGKVDCNPNTGLFVNMRRFRKGGYIRTSFRWMKKWVNFFLNPSQSLERYETYR